MSKQVSGLSCFIPTCILMLGDTANGVRLKQIQTEQQV